MTTQRRIKVRGKQRTNIDPQLFVQLLLAIGRDLQREPQSDTAKSPSPDVFQSAIEDRGAAS